jgi:hypothetical protein
MSDDGVFSGPRAKSRRVGIAQSTYAVVSGGEIDGAKGCSRQESAFSLAQLSPSGHVYTANLCPFYVGAADRRSRRREIIVHNNGGVCKRFLTATGVTVSIGSMESRSKEISNEKTMEDASIGDRATRKRSDRPNHFGRFKSVTRPECAPRTGEPAVTGAEGFATAIHIGRVGQDLVGSSEFGHP